MGKPTKNSGKNPSTKSLDIFAGEWLIGSQCPLTVIHKTAKSVTLELGGVSLGKHFGEVHERKPS